LGVFLQAVNWGSALKQAAFEAFAAIGANDEEIRKRVRTKLNSLFSSHQFMDFSQ
jgi:hypothetical protein